MSVETDASDETSATDIAGDFTALGDIRIAHLALMRQASENETVGPNVERAPNANDIRAFLAKAREAGHVIARESDRRSAQRILDYWSAELVARPAIEKADITPTRLAPFAGGAGSAQEAGAEPDGRSLDEANAPTPSEPDPDLTPDEEAERLRIRVAAQARQWENTRYDGYLLRGKALVQAMNLPAGSDIDAFVRASAKLEDKQRDRIRIWLLTCFILLSGILTFTTIYATKLADYAQNQADYAKGQEDYAKQQAIEAEKAKNQAFDSQVKTAAALVDATRARDEAEMARQAAESGLRDITLKNNLVKRRFAQLEVAGKTLDYAVSVIVDGLIDGRIQLESLNDQLRDLALAKIVGRVNSGELTLGFLQVSLQNALAPLVKEVPKVLASNLPGYKADFLGTNIPLPALTGTRSTDVQAAPANYINYSLVLSRSQRMAFYSAVNLDRSQRLVLQTNGGRPVPDGRLNPDAQPSSDWYATNLAPAQLASAGDVAWGPNFLGDPGTAGLKLSLYTNVLSNSMPQPTFLAEGVWLQLENWMRNQHDPLATKVTIFTGPVFGPAPAGDGAEAIPVLTAYWKVAVSAVSPAAKGAASDPEYVVDAFLVPRDTMAAQFRPASFRVSIGELERLTDINFGLLIEWTDSKANPGPDGKTAADRLAGRLDQLDSALHTERQAIRSDLAMVLPNPDLSVDERRKVVAALTEMASTVNMLPPGRDGRINVLEALNEVPVALWQRPDWRPLLAQARVAAGDIEVRSDTGDTNIGQQTRTLLDQLKRQVGIQPSPQLVYFQFAGMTRGDAEKLTARMRALGWGIPKPGEERIAEATGLNEVRYNPGSSTDRAAAELLAADLTAAGQAAVAKPVAVINPNTLEIWVSI